MSIVCRGICAEVYGISDPSSTQMVEDADKKWP